MYLMICLVFLFLSLKMGLLNGGSLVLEWEISEKFMGEMGVLMVFDWVSCLFLASVFFISSWVSCFSGFYMSHEVFLGRFSHILQTFVFSMAILVMFPGYLGLMVGWDGLGIVSFLLVIYYMNSGSLSAGMITAISNRIGDVCFIFVISILSSFMSYNYMSGGVWSIWALGSLILVGSMTKSAQVPFSAWLPEAMAAPTPVSTLVHSSTLVTAGVYVLIRFSDYLNDFDKTILMVMSILTMILAGSSGVSETDMKKVVALSTLSQVGMMMFCVSVGCNSVAFFHLLVHAFFKALMFMCVGGVIFYSGGNQDARFLGGIWFKLPLTSALLVFSNLSLMGFPFFSGFYSKELVAGSYLGGSCSVIGLALLFISLGFTMMYSIRMMSLVLQDLSSCAFSHYKMESFYYSFSLLMMASGGVFMSMVMQSFYGGFLSITFLHGSFFYFFFSMSTCLLINVLGLLVLVSGVKEKVFVKEFFSSMWFLKLLSGNILSSKFLILVSKYISYVEMGWIRSYIWQNGLKELMFGASNKFRKMNFNMLGLVLFYCFCFIVLVFY
uniref:NADH dehydrogenase subunit 5 n=1 Tax=Tapes dorsatus TaxID=368939 RepID=UPI002037532F|nr:NADH dehydrogenase subunit 5 [Tapes dorsatus]URH16443.1 NADH dehydrogenase subunit 5 [Tapes dorsatus]